MCPCVGSSLSWGYPSSSSREKEREREGGGPPAKPESGFASRDSDQLIEYLRNIQRVQLKLLCSRVCTHMYYINIEHTLAHYMYSTCS